MTGLLESSSPDNPCCVVWTYFGFICASVFLMWTENSGFTQYQMEINITDILIVCTLMAGINLLIWYLLLNISKTNYLSVRYTNPGSWDVSLQPYLKYLSVALCINYLSLWNTQKVQMKGFKLRSCLSTLFQSRLTKTKNPHRFSFSHRLLSKWASKTGIVFHLSVNHTDSLYTVYHTEAWYHLIAHSVVSFKHQWDFLYSTIISLCGS